MLKIKMATSMWNNVNINPPPVASCLYDHYEPDGISEEDVDTLKAALQVIQPSGSVGQALASDEYTLNRLLYKANNQQRGWRWYQMLKRIQKCVKRLQASQLDKFIGDAVSCCLINHGDTGSSIHLPSRQMLEYILVKLMGRAKLCAYILHIAESVFVLVVQNITSGQFLAHNVIYATIASRIWVMMRVTMRDVLNWYTGLRPWTDRLRGTSMQWMPPDDLLPNSLYDWLRADYDMKKYTKAIEQSSRKKGPSWLDKMFAANQASLESSMTEAQTNNGQDTMEVLMTTAASQSTDLGEIIPAEEAAEKRSRVKLKRKRSQSVHQTEPQAKRSRPILESPAREGHREHLESDFLVAHSEERKEDLGVCVDSIPSGDEERKALDKKKQLKRASGELDLESARSEKTTNRAGSEGEARNHKKSLKKKLKRKLEKMRKLPRRDEMAKDSSRKVMSMEEVGIREGPTEPVQSGIIQRLKKKGKTLKTAQKSAQTKINLEAASQGITHAGSNEESMNKKQQISKKKEKTRVDPEAAMITTSNALPRKAKKRRKLHTVSSLVCELGELSRGAPKATSRSQESEIDDIFALLE